MLVVWGITVVVNASQRTEMQSCTESIGCSKEAWKISVACVWRWSVVPRAVTSGYRIHSYAQQNPTKLCSATEITTEITKAHSVVIPQ